jgi:hypothetical protein
MFPNRYSYEVHWHCARKQGKQDKKSPVLLQYIHKFFSSGCAHWLSCVWKARSSIIQQQHYPSMSTGQTQWSLSQSSIATPQYIQVLCSEIRHPSQVHAEAQLRPANGILPNTVDSYLFTPAESHASEATARNNCLQTDRVYPYRVQHEGPVLPSLSNVLARIQADHLLNI